MVIKKIHKQQIDGVGTGNAGGGGVLPLPEALASLKAGIKSPVHLGKKIRVDGIIGIEKKVGFKVTVMEVDEGPVEDVALVPNILIVFKDGGPCFFRFFNGPVRAVIGQDKDLIGLIRIVKLAQGFYALADDRLLIPSRDKDGKFVEDLGLGIGFFLAEKVQADDKKIESIEVDKDEEDIKNSFKNRHSFSLDPMDWIPNDCSIFVVLVYLFVLLLSNVICRSFSSVLRYNTGGRKIISTHLQEGGKRFETKIMEGPHREVESDAGPGRQHSLS